MTSRNDQLLKQKSPWFNDYNPIWVASNIALRRNIDKFKFPAKLSTERRKQIISLLSKELLAHKDLINPYLLNGEEIGPLEKEFLMEHYLSSESFQQAHTGEAFLVDDTGEFLASFNIKDHLHIQIIDIKGDLEGSWNRLYKLEEALSQAVSFAYSHQFGFLTADPAESGTALHVTTFLQLTTLFQTGQIHEVIKKYEDESIETSFFLGQEHPIGDLLIVSNRFTLGINEESILQSIRAYTTKMIGAESVARQKAASNNDMKDKVSRAYGVLNHSYNMDAQEALNAISLLKLGSEMNWIAGVTVPQLNELFFNVRRSHLLRLFPEKISSEEIAHKRSEFIHKTLKSSKLLI